MKNYYFKFQKGNAGFDKLFKSNNLYDEALNLSKDGKDIPLSIYYGKWKANEFHLGIKNIRIDKGLDENEYSRSIDQIKLFFDLEKLNEVIYFWSFYKDIIICLKPNSLKVVDGPDSYIDDNGSLPKTIICKIINVYNKIDLPELFSNINSNQRHNRGTISELTVSANEIAVSLMNKSKILINDSNILSYLSPMEFETLLFMIFSNDKVLCSSYRGGTLKDYDLRIKVTKNYNGIPEGNHWIQVKMKDKIKRNNDIYSAFLGEGNIEDRIIDSVWIKNRINENPVIKRWLKEMIYDYKNIFELS
ncbi:MAG: hypothetical protein CVV49_13830 [Spirochaetae bacterium HGW-Spirochaetae-5]|nr:MAG: hypothetical protein CVV49_13830 [Spirochaetae bacterium HGW-Spirochaetae-5]